MMHEFPQQDMWRLVIDDSLPVTCNFSMKDLKTSLMYDIHVSVRRLGEDTGMSILFDVKPIVDAVFQQIESARRSLPESEIDETHSDDIGNRTRPDARNVRCSIL